VRLGSGGIVSGSYSIMAGFNVGGVELSGFVTRKLIMLVA
jgi:hypothetical protein